MDNFMNILMANWSWYPTGGDWTYIKSIKKIYEENGHKIIPFSQIDSKNEKNNFEKFFVSKIDYKEVVKNKSFKNTLDVINKSIYSVEAKNKLQILIDNVQIDIAQLNNINNTLTPSIIDVLKNNNIPIVWRVIDYKLICPNTTLISQDKICEDCKSHKYYNCTIKKCKKDSYGASILATIESYLYSFTNHYKYIDLYMFQNKFSMDKFKEFGFKMRNSIVMKNPIEISSDASERNLDYILFFGRIEKIKGIYTLLNAMRLLSEIKLIVVGDGAELENCKKFTKIHKLNNVSFIGLQWGEQLDKLISDCSFVVVPSEWYEVSPYSILQSFAFGKPVIGSKLAGIAELVHDKNGLLFEHGNTQDLVGKIKELFYDKEKIKYLGRNAYNYLQIEHSPRKYYSDSIEIFTKIINKL